MRIIGVDPGIALTGWGVLEKNGEPKLVDYGCIRTSKGKASSKRLLSLNQEFVSLLKKLKPKVVVLEKLFFNTNQKTASVVGEARGVIKLGVEKAGLPLVEFTPLQIKSCIVGYGRATKKQIQEMVKMQLKLDKIPKPDDAADAVAAALTYCYYKKGLQ